MRRLLVVGRDRAFTRFVAESLLERSMDAFMPRPDDAWDIARAHSALEAEVLIARGRRRFDAILLDRDSNDQPSLALATKLRAHEATETTPLFLTTDRGRDPHARRTGAERLGVAGFLERPLTPAAVRAALELLDRRRRALIVDGAAEKAHQLAETFARHGFEVRIAATEDDAVQAVSAFEPDVALVALTPQSNPCARLKQAQSERSLAVVLFGPAASGPAPTDNALRADDFVPSPMDANELVRRVEGLIGRGSAAADAREEAPEASSPSEEREHPTSPGRAVSLRAPRSSPSAEQPPPAITVPSALPSQRSARRVPCATSLRIKDGETLLQSRTLDISPGGLHFELGRTLPVGTELDLDFRLPDTDRTIRATGKVTWAGPHGVGVKFTHIDKADLHSIVDYVNQLSRLLFAAQTRGRDTSPDAGGRDLANSSAPDESAAHRAAPLSE